MLGGPAARALASGSLEPVAVAPGATPGVVPIGWIEIRHGDEPLWGPEGWLVCNGQEVECSRYPELARALGGKRREFPWGRRSGTSFTLPDIRSRVPKAETEAPYVHIVPPAATHEHVSASSGSGSPGSSQAFMRGDHWHPVAYALSYALIRAE